MIRLTAGCLLLLLSLFLVGAVPAMGADSAEGQRSKEEIGEIIREYLLNNPEVIFEAAERHREKQRQLQSQRDRTLLKQHQQALLADPDSFVGGNPDGDVTLVEFFDYQCGYCKRFAPILEKIKKEDPNIRVVYKEFPVLGSDSIRGAQALKMDMEDPTIQDIIGKAHKLATALSITGTPAIIVGNQIARGMIPFAELARMIAQARADGS